jgi:hypothetical protein
MVLSKTMPIKKGALVVVSQGAYSEYAVAFIGNATQDFNPDEIVATWIKKYPEQGRRYQFDEDAFLKWLTVESGLLEEVPCVEWHLQDYSSVQEGWVSNNLVTGGWDGD